MSSAALTFPSSVALEPALEAEKRRVLKTAFGFDEFRPGQERVIDALLAGRDVLAVMPTGAGKSLCYQVPALVSGGLAVVVSPLIALMDDQVAGLRLDGVCAEAIHSGKSRDENVASWRRVASGEAKLVYMAPERLMTERMLGALGRLPVSLVAIDEAHCISQWGHSFRSEYLTLGRLRDALPGARIVALTATADDATRADIIEKLFSGKADSFVSGFDRPNIAISVADKRDVGTAIERYVTARPGMSGVVYRLSRKKVEETAANLRKSGVNALAYHAGLEASERAAAQETFLAEPGIVMVATVAFGMGIDKSDVRYVVHGDIPGSLEAYYQEIGRAGRDGAPAEALMFYGLEDVRTRRRFIDEQESDDERKRVEARRLDALVGFCETTSCRRQTLLAYFGETTAPCGNCDVCLDPPEVIDGTREARLLLGLVAATGERFGAAHIVALAVGHMSETVEARGHDRLPGFGKGAERPAAEWRGIVRQLVALGALKVEAGAYGGLQLSPKGGRILDGAETVTIAKPKEKKRERRRMVAESAGFDGVDGELLGRLKALRRELAIARAVPAYVIFADRTLVEMAATKPQTPNALARVKGVGAAKLDAFGDVFLKVLNGG
ncbi:ATP-dependent DNA helicase RecQ [Methylopila capsulata]|uniref:DNA helicase RecQ n=1 Tax=Methylopila capsulata TaxID=61654 RepID=A0A9W6MSE3_9HYPH|nr:DNA helicase RecQ [Methylopila capsulata]MBM7852516.1 ATP-dependent DNA helicase RecQ [Methylopila capsulata]GLK56725.1 ATP-dependent DNA helicase RecQ [Methylopila capsulata]